MFTNAFPGPIDKRLNVCPCDGSRKPFFHLPQPYRSAAQDVERDTAVSPVPRVLLSPSTHPARRQCVFPIFINCRHLTRPLTPGSQITSSIYQQSKNFPHKVNSGRALVAFSARVHSVVRFGRLDESWSSKVGPTNNYRIEFGVYKSAHAFPLGPHPLSAHPSDFYSPASFTMIYITAFVLTLFLTQIARAMPRTCSDLISPESDDTRGLSYGDGDAQYTITNPVSVQPFKVTFDPTYDNPNGSMNTVSCSDGQNGLASRFPTFGRVPNFPHIGGAFNIVWNSTNCGACWILTNPANNVSINFTAIDFAGNGFNIAQEAFEDLNGGVIGNGTLQVDARTVPARVCGL